MKDGPVPAADLIANRQTEAVGYMQDRAILDISL
jgi:hypothetical protein